MVAIPFVLWHASSRAFTATLGDTGVRRAQGLGARHGHGAWPALQLAPAGSCRGHPCSSCRHATELKEAGKNYWTEGRAFHQFFSLLVTSYAVALFFRHVAFFKQSTMVCVDKVFALLFFAEVACRVQDLGLRQYGGKVSSWLDTGLMSLLMLDAFILSRSQMEVLILSWVRFLRGILNLTVIFEVVVDAPLWLQRLTGILFFVALSVLLREAGIQSVVGMLGVFGALLAMRRIAGPARAAVVYGALEPGKGFLVKWATLFFVPALVKLPLTALPPGEELARLGLLTCASFLATLLFTIVIASLFPTTEHAEPARPVAAASSAAPAEPAYRLSLLAVYLAAMAGGVLSARMGWMPGLAQSAYMLAGTLLGFVGGMISPAKVRQLVPPMFVSMLTTWGSAALWPVFTGSGQAFKAVVAAYTAKPGAGALLTDLLAPTLMALGLLLFERRRLLAGEFVPMLGTSFAAAGASLFGTAALARGLGLPTQVAASSLLHNISSPFALELTGVLGASPTLTITLLVITGFIGVSAAPPVFNVLRVKCARTRGLAMGAAAHGLGAVALAESDEEAFPYSALGFMLVGLATTSLVEAPPVRGLLLRIISG